MTVNINVRITDEQYQEIKFSGQKISEYTRDALDFYNVRKGKSLLQHEINIVQDCIDLLEDHKKECQKQLQKLSLENLYESEENVKKTDEKSIYKNDENVKKIYKNDEKSLQNVNTTIPENIYKTEENVKEMQNHHLFNRYKPYLETLSKLLYYQKTVPDDTKKMISKETSTTMREISDFIYGFHIYIKYAFLS